MGIDIRRNCNRSHGGGGECDDDCNYCRHDSITGTAFDNLTRVTITVTVRPRIAGSIDARPNVDTLFPTGTRALTVTVKDQNNVTIAGAPVVWRSMHVTATAQGFPTAIELRMFGSNALLASGSAAGNGLPATINCTNTTANFPFVYIRVFGGPVQNDVVAIVIDP